MPQNESPNIRSFQSFQEERPVGEAFLEKPAHKILVMTDRRSRESTL
jgi:hypothetical protein